jgi:hypothetical protein
MKTFLNNLNSRYISNIHLSDKNLCHYMLRPSLNHRQASKVKFISATSTRSFSLLQDSSLFLFTRLQVKQKKTFELLKLFLTHAPLSKGKANPVTGRGGL